MRLCEVISLQPLRFDFFGINFPSHPHSQLPFIFSLFPGRTTEQVERSAEPMSALRYPTPPPPPLRHCSPLHLPGIPLQGNYHARVAPFRVAAHLWRNISLEFCKRHSPCSSFDIVTTGEGGGRFERTRRMNETRKRQGWGVKRILRRRRRYMTTAMTRDSTAFLVSIQLRLDGGVCNALLIFIALPSTSPFYPSVYVTVAVVVACSSSAPSLSRLLIRLPMLFILLLV